ncbi:hypothetical protein HYC85_017148 [Camellia sinensis]|uniref:F-box domain-containing protein n=1 Tax=Camellia sinensis TaxID=4442 RepID=A0A7J7H1U3_CAMSI|nr:hypothetical protein HYC85_017148 [Camellia sinensis]
MDSIHVCLQIMVPSFPRPPSSLALRPPNSLCTRSPSLLSGGPLSSREESIPCSDLSLNIVMDLSRRFAPDTAPIALSHLLLKVYYVSECAHKSLGCPNLQVLSIKSSPNVTDESIAKIASGCPKLRELDVSYCYEISHESLALIGKNCRDLKILKRNFMNWLDPSQHCRNCP